MVATGNAAVRSHDAAIVGLSCGPVQAPEVSSQSNVCVFSGPKPASCPAQWAYPFNEPVDTKRYDNYLNYVKRPIDFGTIKRKLEAGGYKAPDDMHADIQQAGLQSEADGVPVEFALQLVIEAVLT